MIKSLNKAFIPMFLKHRIKCLRLFLQTRTISINASGPYNFVDGQRCNPVENNGEIKVLEPALGSVLCSLPSSGPAEVTRAVYCAKEAFKEWRNTSYSERSKLLLAAAQEIRHNLEDIARLEVRDNGKPIWEARIDIESCAQAFEYFGGVVNSLSGFHIPLEGDSFAMVCREPLGVIAGIGAWNFPMQTCSWKAAPSLACGNTMVYKPSQFTPITAVILAEILSHAGFPDGVFNIVQGDGFTGNLLCCDPNVAKISFTGSVPTGKMIMKNAAEGMKKVTLELGGKSPLIIFEDADIVNAVKATLMANFMTQGEVCSNGTRVYVHEDIAEEFVHKLIKATEMLKIGDPFDEETTVGATITKEHAEKVLKYIESAKKEGAVVSFGGERIHLPPPYNGYFLSPCILTECSDEMIVVKEEVFGAVASIMKFKTEDEVISRANDTEFGLAGGVFTRNLQKAFRVIKQIEAGSLWINTYNLYPPQLPFGGYKMSGIGRENGLAVLEHYTQLKTVYVEMGDVNCGPLYR